MEGGTPDSGSFAEGDEADCGAEEGEDATDDESERGREQVDDTVGDSEEPCCVLGVSVSFAFNSACSSSVFTSASA